MFSTKLAAALTVLFAVTSAVSAHPNAARPQITSPKAGDVWTVGSTQTISWDASALQGDQTRAPIFLGFVEDGSLNEHLDVDHPLATNVSTAAGSVTVTVPDVIARDNYIVALFGSGNISPKFTIHN